MGNKNNGKEIEKFQFLKQQRSKTMNTIEAILKRKSTRLYKNIQISEENLNLILKAGMQAPLALGAYDSVHLTIVQDEQFLNEIGDAVTDMMEKVLGKRVNKNFGAPTMIIVSTKTSKLPGMDYANAACILENMLIAATSLGIDNVMCAGCVNIMKQEHYKNKLQIPKDYEPIMCAYFGYAQNEEEPKNHIISTNRV